MPNKDAKVQEKVINLEVDSELRFEVENRDEIVHLEIQNGTAEIFGTELVKGKTYTFVTGAKVAVFTWQGCSLLFKSKTNVSFYISRETPMTFYLNCHCCLEHMRQKCETDGKRGPVTMIVGPQDVGKSSLTRILLNYAVRMGGLSRRPIFVDVDPGRGHISVPGSVGAMVVERPASVEDGFIQVAPLVYHFGHTDVLENPVLYNKIISKMASVVHERMSNNKKVNCSGIFINTFGWTKGKGYHHLTHIAQCFEVDVILVLDQERVYNELVRDMPSFVKVVLLPKSGGVVNRTRSNRQEARDARMREYFYGTPQMQLHPHSFEVKFSEVKIYRLGAPSLPDSCLPIGMKSDEYLTKPTIMQPGPHLLHHVLAISFIPPPPANNDDLVQSNIAGFVCVTNVDQEKQVVTVLSPQPKPLPDACLLLSEVQFVDNN